MEINFMSYVYLTGALLPYLKESKGSRFGVISSLAGLLNFNENKKIKKLGELDMLNILHVGICGHTLKYTGQMCMYKPKCINSVSLFYNFHRNIHIYS